MAGDTYSQNRNEIFKLRKQKCLTLSKKCHDQYKTSYTLTLAHSVAKISLKVVCHMSEHTFCSI